MRIGIATTVPGLRLPVDAQASRRCPVDSTPLGMPERSSASERPRSRRAAGRRCGRFHGRRSARGLLLALAAVLVLATSGCAGVAHPGSRSAAGLVAAAPAVDRPPVSSRPNLVVVLSDDQRRDALGASGNPAVLTPVMDRMAREGVSFRQATVSVSQCHPIRASLLTGLAALRGGGEPSRRAGRSRARRPAGERAGRQHGGGPARRQREQDGGARSRRAFRALGGQRGPYESSLRVPLIMTGPRLASALVSDLPVSSMDLPPTLLSIAGVPVPESWPGRDLTAVFAGRLDVREAFAEWSDEESPKWMRHNRDPALGWPAKP